MKFLGQTYRKQTAWDGMADLGVVQIAAHSYAVYWRSKNGKYSPLRTDILPAMNDRHALQVLLDTWAAEKQLEAA